MTLLVARSMYSGGASRTRTRSTRCGVAERARRPVRAVHATRILVLPASCCADQSRHESFLVWPGLGSSRLFLYSNIQTSRPATVSGSRCMHRAPAVRDGMFHNCYACRRASQARYTQTPGSRTVPSTTSSDESRTHVVRPLRIESLASVEARCASLIHHFCLCRRRQDRSPGGGHPRWFNPTQRHSRRTNRRGGNVAECVTRVRNGSLHRSPAHLTHARS